jgi:diguanylate cyclase (GGDEF)-like protein
MFDVDHFKLFNDTHGHDQGDRVLISIGQTMQDSVRDIDICCRYGGEEFLIILPDADRSGAMVLAQRLRRNIENTRVDGLQVTISVGVSTYPLTDVETPQAFIEAADTVLYLAKDEGRNCVRHTHSDVEAEAGIARLASGTACE